MFRVFRIWSQSGYGSYSASASQPGGLKLWRLIWTGEPRLGAQVRSRLRLQITWHRLHSRQRTWQTSQGVPQHSLSWPFEVPWVRLENDRTEHVFFAHRSFGTAHHQTANTWRRHWTFWRSMPRVHIKYHNESIGLTCLNIPWHPLIYQIHNGTETQHTDPSMGYHGFVLFVDSIAACSAPFMKAEVPVSRFASLNALLCCKLEIAFDRTRDCRLW